MNYKIVDIALKLKTKYLDKAEDKNDISLFLCGGNSADESRLRKGIGEKITSKASKYKYSVYYPEDLFIELISGHQRQNLLTLENLLADCVNTVVILLQSPGTFVELGAFTNHEKLKDKLIVVIDPAYSRAKSFINLGPVRYLKTRTKSKILYLKLDYNNISNLVSHISDSAREISKYSFPVRDFTNPIYAYDFYMALVYVLDPVPKSIVFTILKAINTENEELVNNAAETIINSLISERKVALSSGFLSLTDKGTYSLIYENKTYKRISQDLSYLAELRIHALNLILRKNNRKVWGEAVNF